MNGLCNFAPDGSYGHECGKPALWAFSVPSFIRPGKIFWVLRCQACLGRQGSENQGLGQPEKFDSDKHKQEAL